MGNYLDISQVKPIIKPGAASFKVTHPEHDEQGIAVDWVKQTYGQRPYMRCPLCGKRVRRLYISDGWSSWKCRRCAGINLYKGIQNTTKGGADELYYRIKRYDEQHDIQITFPFNYCDYAGDDRIYNERFVKHLKVLQALENMRFMCLFFGDLYKPAVIRMVTNGTHPLMQLTIHELATGLYHWNTGNPARLEEVKL